MRVTQYDKVSSWLLCTVAGLVGLTLLLLAVWLTNRLPAPPDAVPVEFVDLPGGYEDGSPDETPLLESPEEEVPDPAIAETAVDQTEIQEMLETVVELSESASQQVETVIQSEASENSGRVGSASGTGGRPLGTGGGGLGGIAREQRWMIKFDDGDLETYAKQLDHFGIELGAFFASEGKIVFITKMSAARPTVREVRTGGDQRLYMTWKGGSRKAADEALFRKAGINAQGASLMHFYPKETEEMLARVEVAYRNRKSSEIRRTYFSVLKDGAGFKFGVTSQSYVR